MVRLIRSTCPQVGGNTKRLYALHTSSPKPSTETTETINTTWHFSLLCIRCTMCANQVVVCKSLLKLTFLCEEDSRALEQLSKIRWRGSTYFCLSPSIPQRESCCLGLDTLRQRLVQLIDEAISYLRVTHGA